MTRMSDDSPGREHRYIRARGESLIRTCRRKDNVNPFPDADDDDDAFQDYERRRRQIEADKIFAERMQQQEFNQQQRLPSSTENQERLKQTDEELAVCLLANYLHLQDGSTSQSEPEQTFQGAACSSSGVIGRAEIGELSQSRLGSLHPPQCNFANSINNGVSTTRDEQALEEALALSLLESQHHINDEVSDQHVLDQAIALSLSSHQQEGRAEGMDKRLLNEAIALNIDGTSARLASGGTRGNEINQLEYEELLEIEDLIGCVDAMTLSSTQLQLLPTHKYEERPQKSSGAVDEKREPEPCAICLVVYESGCDVKLLPCLHTFHAGCIDEWLQRKAACPTCNIRVEL